MATQTIRIYGEKTENNLLADNAGELQVTATYRIGGAARGAAESIDLKLEEGQPVEITFDDGTIWMTDSEGLEDLFPEATMQRGVGAAVLELPVVLRSDSQQRGFIKDIALKLLKVFAKKAVVVALKKVAEALENKQLEVAPGLYSLSSSFALGEKPGTASHLPYLLFIHGTATSTQGSFGKLYQDPESGRVTTHWAQLVQLYQGNMLAYQHRSVTESPLENALQLMEQLPSGARLHIVSHSRGGIVGDILSRFCIPGTAGNGFSAHEINYLTKNDRQHEVALIAQIARLAAVKNITVEKFVRVACPASGTTILSKRLDHVLNVLLNLIGGATGQLANPIYGAFKELIAAVLASKDDPAALPGLEAMNPDSPFIEMINNGKPDTLIASPLAVISGNSKVDLNVKALLVIITKLYFLGKNDFIVDTASMYNGAMRAKDKVQYFLHEGPETDHFSYFHNAVTQQAIMRALQHEGDSLIAGFSRMNQQATDQEIRNAMLGLQGGEEFRENVSGKRPIVVLLPGIMGSNLVVKGDKVWINYIRFVAGQLMRLEHSEGNNPNIFARSLIRTSYTKLADYLQKDYDIVTFPFDWRLQMNECAAQLALKLQALQRHGQPIKLVAHSMGGVVVRDFIVNHPALWSQLNASAGFQLLFLGTPLGGSYRIPYVLFGEDGIIRSLDKADLMHTRKELLEVFNSMPGLLSLLPLAKVNDNGQAHDFANRATWEAMRNAWPDTGWPLPSAKSLKQFGDYRDRILAVQDTIDYSNAVYIAGRSRQDQPTPADFEIKNGRLRFLFTHQGDESVTWASGIPAAMSKAGNVYYSDVQHGELANDTKDARLFTAIADVLAKGSTTALRHQPPVLRGTQRNITTPPAIQFDRTEGGLERSLLGLDSPETDVAGPLQVNVSVRHGDLKYASYPVMAGHFYNDGLFSAELGIDQAMQGELSKRLRTGIYPGAIGTSDLISPPANHQFKGALIVGLGKQGELTASMMSKTVEIAVARYLAGYNNYRVQQGRSNSGTVGITTLAIASGFGGFTVESSIRAVLQGILQANTTIKESFPASPLVGDVEFIEVYQDKVLACMGALKTIEQEANRNLNIAWANKKMTKVPGNKERIPLESGSNWWTRISVSALDDKSGGCDCDRRGMRFSVSTTAAREEQQFVCSGSGTINELLQQMSTNNQWSRELAKAMFELMIPHSFKDLIGKQSNIKWVLDTASAAYPWELLHDGNADSLPLSVGAGMIRQLATADYRMNINQVAAETALVVGDPKLWSDAMQLRGAEMEAQKVAELLVTNGFDTGQPLIRASAAQILLALFSKSYKIVHLAGHGVFHADPKQPTGMLIGKDAYITPCEIQQMGTVPELVFMNCCFLGQIDSEAEAMKQDRWRLAANVGTQLISIGVKAVVVAGWAVDDSAAVDFAQQFYQHLFMGYNFGEAVQKARAYIYERYHRNNNTWGAYQCYGDPFYTLRNSSRKKDIKHDFSIPEEAEIELGNLLNKLETGEFDTVLAVDSLSIIGASVDKAGIRTARITELEAFIYAGLTKHEQAIEKFQDLLKQEVATFSGKALEIYCNIRAKYYAKQFVLFPKKAPELLVQIDGVIQEFEFMQRLGKTAQRMNLIGSAFKFKATMLAEPDKGNTYALAARQYKTALDMVDGERKLYSLTNWLSLEQLLHLSGRKTTITKKQALALLHEEYAARKVSIGVKGDLNYWDFVAEADILLALFLHGDPAISYEQLSAAYQQAWAYGGNMGHRQAVTEHLECLLDALSMAPSEKSQRLREHIQQLKAMLDNY